MVDLMSRWFLHNIMKFSTAAFFSILNRKQSVARIEKKRMVENADELYMKVIRFTRKE